MNKYIKYKMRYIEQKEEIINLDRIISPNEYVLYKDDMPSINFKPEYDGKYEMIHTKYSRILDNDTEFIFTVNCSKALFYKKLPDDMKYSDARMSTFAIVIHHEPDLKDIINIFTRCHKIIIPLSENYDPNQPYTFISKFNIFGKTMNIFENIFSKRLSNIFRRIYTLWMKSVYYKTFYDFNIINDQNIFTQLSLPRFIDDKIFFYNMNIDQIFVYLNDRTNSKFKLNIFKNLNQFIRTFIYYIL
jgi:hypothetical protein